MDSKVLVLGSYVLEFAFRLGYGNMPSVERSISFIRNAMESDI